MMKLVIEDKMTISMLQKEFNKNFPYLKIEFFNKPHKREQGNLKKEMITDPDTLLGECRKTHTQGIISFDKKESVAQLEELFRTHYGLYIQVFRKSGKVWLETMITDHWTLEEQNRQGEDLFRMMNKPDREK